MPKRDELPDGLGFKRLLLAVDLPAASDEPVARALALAAELRASVVVVSVVESRAHHPVTSRRVDQVREVHERAANDLATRGRAMGVEVAYLIWQGDPADAIIEAADSELVDLIVIGGPPADGSGGTHAWTVSHEVVQRAQVPVLVVPGEPPQRLGPA